MIGKKELIIDASDFIKGMSTSSEVNDGGFSTETDAVNLAYLPGALYAPAAAVDSDTDTRLTGNIIASSPDMELIAANNRLLVGDNDTYYKYNGTKIIASPYTGGTASTTSAGFTDIITFGGEAYVSCKERIKRWVSGNTITDLGSFTSANVPHPMIVYENNFYAADGNLLLQATAVNTMPTTILTLDNRQVIMSIGIDPGTGLMLLSTTSTVDVGGTLPSINKLLWYDGNSLKVTKSVIIEDTIYGFHTNGGTTYVGYGKNIGYMNGSGISFLRKLINVTNDVKELPYKHHFASIGNTMYVLDGLQILAFGEILPGSKKPYYCFKNNTNSSKPLAIANGGNNNLIYGFATNKFYSFNTRSVATTNTMTFYTNEYSFPRPIFLRSVVIEYVDAVVNNDDNRSLYAFYNPALATILYVQGTTNLKNTSGASVYFTENIIGFLPQKTRTIKLRYLASSANTGVKRIIVYYDVAE